MNFPNELPINEEIMSLDLNGLTNILSKTVLSKQ